MANIVKLLVDDSGYNQKIKNAASTFMSFVGQVGGAKGQFSALTEAIKSSTMAQEVLNQVMAKNPMGAVMTAATTAATMLISKLTEVSEEQQKIAEAAEARAEQERHENETVVNSVSKVITEYELLRQKWSALSDEHAKADWLKENKNKFKQLGIAVNDVKTAEDVFVNNTQAVCNALIARAKAEAYGELYKEQLKKKIGNVLNPTVENGRRYVKQKRRERDIGSEGMAGVTAEDINWKRESVMKNGAVTTNTVFESYKQSGLNKLNTYKRNMALARQREDDAQLEQLGNLMVANQGDYEAGLKGLGIWDDTQNNGKGGKGGRSSKTKPQPVINPISMETVKGALPQLFQETIPITFEVDPTGMTALQKLEAELQSLKDQQLIFGGASPELWQMFQGGINRKQLEIDTFKGNIKPENPKPEKQKEPVSLVKTLGTVSNGMEDMVSGIENLGVEIPEGLKGVLSGMQSVITILSGISTIVMAIEAISAADAIIPFAGGGVAGAASGMVVGRTHSLDQIPAALNAGEVVLNRAQSAIIALQLEGGGLQNLYLDTEILGENMRIILNNNGKRTGKGRYVQTNKR